MANIRQLIVYQEARQIVRHVADIDARFGDLNNQMRRAAISIVSNIAEGAGAGSDRQLARYLKMARAATNELQAQLEMAADLGFIQPTHPVLDDSDRLGRRLTCFIRRLEPG